MCPHHPHCSSLNSLHLPCYLHIPLSPAGSSSLHLIAPCSLLLIPSSVLFVDSDAPLVLSINPSLPSLTLILWPIPQSSPSTLLYSKSSPIFLLFHSSSYMFIHPHPPSSFLIHTHPAPPSAITIQPCCSLTSYPICSCCGPLHPAPFPPPSFLAPPFFPPSILLHLHTIHLKPILFLPQSSLFRLFSLFLLHKTSSSFSPLHPPPASP